MSPPPSSALPQLRRLPHRGKKKDARLADSVWRANNVMLTKSVYVEKEAYDQLEPWQKFRLKAQAVGISARTAVITGFAAALLWDVPILNRKHYDMVELVLPGTRCPPSRAEWADGVYYHNSTLPEEDVTEIGGIRVVTLARLLFDITTFHGQTEGLVFLEAVLNKNELRHAGYTKKYFAQYLTGREGQWGVNKTLRVVKQALYGIQSPWETFARCLIVAEPKLKTADIIPQAAIRTINPSGWISTKYVDLLLFGWLCVEIDGRIKYATTQTQAEVLHKERCRETGIQNLGYQFLRLAPMEVEKQLVPLILRIKKQVIKRISPNRHRVLDLQCPIYDY